MACRLCRRSSSWCSCFSNGCLLFCSFTGYFHPKSSNLVVCMDGLLDGIDGPVFKGWCPKRYIRGIDARRLCGSNALLSHVSVYSGDVPYVCSVSIVEHAGCCFGDLKRDLFGSLRRNRRRVAAVLSVRQSLHSLYRFDLGPIDEFEARPSMRIPTKQVRCVFLLGTKDLTRTVEGI